MRWLPMRMEVHPAFVAQYNDLAPPQVHRNPNAHQEWALQQKWLAGHAFDDFAASGPDRARNLKLMGIGLQ